MKSNSLFLALAIVGGLFSTASDASGITGTTSLQGTFETEVLPATCTGQVMYNNVPASEIDFGDIFISQFQNIATAPIEKDFQISFTECEGVLKINVAAQPGAGNSCSGDNYATTGATNTAVLVGQRVMSSGTDTQLKCVNGTPSNAYTHEFGSRNNPSGVVFNMFAQWVVANGKTAADVTAGQATSPVTFIVTYE